MKAKRISSVWTTILCTFVLLICTPTSTIVYEVQAAERYLVEQGADNKAIAIFVHGFTGNYKKTWGKLPDLLTSDETLRSYDFLFWGYPTKLFRANETISTIGEHLKTEIDYLPKSYERIVLVGHSMGGLVIRSFVTQALLDGKGADLERIADVIFFGTPNEGLLKAEFIPKLISQQIDDMGVASDFIVKLRKHWVQRVTAAKVDDAYTRRLRTLAVAGLSDHFVPKESVQSFFRETAVTDGNHTSMVKPDDINHLTYRILQSRLVAAKMKDIDIPSIRVKVRNTDRESLTVVGTGTFQIFSPRALAADLEVGAGKFEIAEAEKGNSFGKDTRILGNREQSLIVKLINPEQYRALFDAKSAVLTLHFSTLGGREITLDRIPFSEAAIVRSEFAMEIRPKVLINEGLTVKMQLDSRFTSLVCTTPNAPIVGECPKFSLTQERSYRFFQLGEGKLEVYDAKEFPHAHRALIRVQQMRGTKIPVRMSTPRFMTDVLTDPTMKELLSELLPSDAEWRALERDHAQEAFALNKWLVEWVGLLDPFFRLTFINATNKALRINKQSYTSVFRTTVTGILIGVYTTPRYVLELKDGHHQEAIDPPIEVPAQSSKSIDLMLTLKETRPGAQYRITLVFESDDGKYVARTKEFEVVFWKGKVSSH